MASIHQIRGALLEEIVLLLLARSGYRRILVGEEGTRNGPAGLEVEGRGTHHQIDALVTQLHSHAFVYPIRLLVEAKCQGKPVRLTVIRSAVGTLFDINQNYFSGRLAESYATFNLERERCLNLCVCSRSPIQLLGHCTVGKRMVVADRKGSPVLDRATRTPETL